MITLAKIDDAGQIEIKDQIALTIPEDEVFDAATAETKSDGTGNFILTIETVDPETIQTVKRKTYYYLSEARMYAEVKKTIDRFKTLLEELEYSLRISRD